MLKRVRGTRDILETEAKKFEFIIKTLKKHTKLFGYEEIILPSLEESSLYFKSLGSSSDIVMKEMFYIKDKTYVLRPEGTAGAIRAYIMNYPSNEKKQWSYAGSMFRHEKPQNGRFREFFQYGIENIGGSWSGLSDAEVISIGSTALLKLKIPFELNINTLGSFNSRQLYNEELCNYFKDKNLSDISKKRLEQRNSLRILDSKEEKDKEFILNAPLITEFLSEDDLNYFNEIKNSLKELEVDYVENPRLVRGLDYYSHVCFEFICENKIGF